jgi:type II secretory pathway pseudopilin PulG
LIELVVVITIIVILMALLFPAFKGVQDQAKRTQAKNDVTQIVTAVSAYYTEYGKYPTPDTGSWTQDTVYGDSNNTGSVKSYQLFNTLRAIATASPLNPKLIVFMQGNSVKDAANPRSGFDSTGNFYDPWGRTYAVAVDLSYDNVTQTYLPTYTDLTYDTEPSCNCPGIRAGAIAYSFGIDGKQGTNGDNKYQGSDDVLSWQ